MSSLRAPRVEVGWNATAKGAAFGGYGVYRRPSRARVVPWEKIAAITVPAGYTPATVEAQHNAFHDHEAGWAVAGGIWADGFDYTVTVLDLATGIEAPIGSSVDLQNQVTPDANPWVVCNAAPFLNFPVGIALETSTDSRSIMARHQAAGRDLELTRTALELPSRAMTVKARYLDRVGEDVLRTWRAAAQSGRALALMLSRGDRLIGGIDAPSGIAHGQVGDLEASGLFVETQRSSSLADHNLPAGLVLNGSTQYVTIPDNAIINPGSGPFSIVCAAAFAGSGAQRHAFSKGNAGVGDGWFLRTTVTPNQLNFFLDGATTSGGPTLTSATPFDGKVHVAIGTHSGTAQALYLDDTPGATAATPAATSSVTTGAITNAIAATIGAHNAGAAGFMAMSPVVLVAYYQRELTPTEAQNAARAALGYPGYRLPANPALLIDLRDQGTWQGYGSTFTDLSAIPPILSATAVASPATRGIPWALANLDRYG